MNPYATSAVLARAARPVMSVPFLTLSEISPGGIADGLADGVGAALGVGLAGSRSASIAANISRAACLSHSTADSPVGVLKSTSDSGTSANVTSSSATSRICVARPISPSSGSTLTVLSVELTNEASLAGLASVSALSARLSSAEMTCCCRSMRSRSERAVARVRA